MNLPFAICRRSVTFASTNFEANVTQTHDCVEIGIVPLACRVIPVDIHGYTDTTTTFSNEEI
jgi:hypothetical protein